jgi:phage-related protein
MKPLEWIASSKKDLKTMPDEVQDNVGYGVK